MRLVLNYACLGMMAPVLPQGPTVDFAMPVTLRTAAHRTAESTIIQSNGAKIARTRTIESVSGQHRDQENNNLVNRQGHSKSFQFFTLNPVESKFSNGGLANSPINVDNLEMQLLGNPDRQKVNYVVSGFREGFHIGFRPHAVKLKSAKSNCPSSTEHSVVIDNYLTTEIHAGRVSGPVKTPPFPTVQVSRFGVIPKKNKANAWRLILDLSFPLGHSVNAGIDKSEFPVCYTKVDDAIRLITRLGRGALMAKIDIKHAYRIVPVHPDDYYLLCMKWRDHYFVDRSLPFGLRSAPYIFNSLADLFEWILINNYLVPELLHYLDDYLTLGPPASPVCARSLHAIQNAANHIGIPLAPDKVEGPTTCLTFLGIELDSVQMIARLPADKLAELVLLIHQWGHKKYCKRKELESLIGKLNHACYVVPTGRTFLRRLINLLRDSKRYWKSIRIPKECQLDLQWWIDFLPTWNGIYFFDLPEWAPLPDFELSSDASGNQGFGVYNNGAWFYQAWLPVQQPLGMAYKELFPIVLACHVWGPSWSNMRIKFWCDNQSVVHIIQSGTSKDEQIMHLVRALFLVTARFNFRICAAHVPGKTNRLADALSRFNLQEFHRLAPEAQPTPVQIPKSLLARLTCNL